MPECKITESQEHQTMNVFTFSGRVGADAELKSTQSGEKVLSFRVANDVGFGDRKTTQWIDCSFWGRRAEAVANYVKKGDKITVSGEVKIEEFQRRDGTPGSKLAVRVNELDLASRQESAGAGGEPTRSYPSNGRGGGGGRDYGAEPSRGGAGGRSGGKPAFDQDLDDEIPFIFN
jgi:single-strand DNA-binding protein